MLNKWPTLCHTVSGVSGVLFQVKIYALKCGNALEGLGKGDFFLRSILVCRSPLTGTNHTLPTNGYARMYSGVSLDSFVKKVTFQQLTPEGIKASRRPNPFGDVEGPRALKIRIFPLPRD